MKNILNKQIINKMISNSEKYEEADLDDCVETTNHLKKKIQFLISQLRLERFKTRLYHNLIKQNTSICIDDIVTEEEDGIHIYNIKEGNIEVFIHDCMKNEDGLIFTHLRNPNSSETIIEPISSPLHRSRSPKRDSLIDKPKKKMYRSIKMSIDIMEEPTDDERSDHIKSVDAIILNKQQDIVNSPEWVPVDFKRFFESLKNAKTYPKIMEDLKQNRQKMFGRLNLYDYTNLILEHVKIIEEIFQEKKYTPKKITTIISKGLSALENRLISYGDYTNTHIEIDEITKIGVVLDVYSKTEKEYIPYTTQNNVYNLFYNYGTVLFPIKQTLERYLFNRYGFNNIIYLPLPKNIENDPYSFYTLESVKDKKRCWKMDCRLEELTTNIIANILPYMIGMFRKIYKDVFNDNEFRVDFLKRSQITECECEQLLQNIQLLSHPQEFSKILRKIVKNNSTFTPTEHDKFNICSDDSLQRKRFAEKEDVDMVDTIKQLFDGISSENAVDFNRTR